MPEKKKTQNRPFKYDMVYVSVSLPYPPPQKKTTFDVNQNLTINSAIGRA